MSISLSTNSARECRLELRKSAKPRRSIRREIRTVALATSTTSIQTVAPFLAAPSPSLRRGFWSKHRVNSQRKERARRSGRAREAGSWACDDCVSWETQTNVERLSRIGAPKDVRYQPISFDNLRANGQFESRTWL